MNRNNFFSEIKPSLFHGKFTQGQVDGLTAILDAFDTYSVYDLKYQAYMLATVFHECATTMQPISEYGKGKKYTYGKRIKMSRKPYSDTDQIFYGRGYVQLTWYENYDKAGKFLCIDLLHKADLALEPRYAAGIMIGGMTQGWFTGKKLSDYFSESKTDWVNARRIINGTDKASLIAGYAQKFYNALVASKE